MNLIVIGINYKIATVSVREKFSILPENQPEALSDLLSRNIVSEAVILSTCNRTEIYAVANGSENNVKEWFLYYNNCLNVSNSHIYIYKNIVAVQHLFKVASGLESQVIGEVQILGQLKQAYKTAKSCNSVKTYLDKLFQKSFSVAKKIRTETKIGDFHVSVANSAVFFAKQIFGDISNRNALLIGAGVTIASVAKYLKSSGINKITIANRTYSKAKAISADLSCDAIQLELVNEVLFDSDIVISATSSRLPVLGKGLLESSLIKRKHKPMFLLDLAVPRDIEPEAGDLDEVFLYTVDDIKLFIDVNLKERKLAAINSEVDIENYANSYIDWARSKRYACDILCYRENSHKLKNTLLEKFKRDLSSGADPELILEKFGNKLTNQLIHNPTQILNRVISSNYPDKNLLLKQFLKINLPED